MRGKNVLKRRVQSHIYPARCLPHHSFGRRTSSSTQKLCFIMNEWWCVSTRCCFNWLRAEQLWCMRHFGGRERWAPHYRSLFPLFTPPSFGATEAAGRACQPCEGSSRDKAWAERRAADVTKSNSPSCSQTGGNPLKNYIRRLSFCTDKMILTQICESVVNISKHCSIQRCSRSNRRQNFKYAA